MAALSLYRNTGKALSVMNNRKRVFSEALSLDAWHDPFQIGTSSAVFVDLTFKEGRLGGSDPEIPFTFKVCLKKALLSIDLEEPLEIDRKTIARDVPGAEIEVSRIIAAKKTAERSLGASASLSPEKLRASIMGFLSSKKEISKEDVIKMSQKIPEILTIPQAESEHRYNWAMEPSWEQHLSGQPWNPVEYPRIKIKPPKILSAVMPAIRVSISCALEDVDIIDIQPKDKSISSKLKEIKSNQINISAAQQHLKMVLRDSDLEPESIDNRFLSLIIANILATEE
jgi:hypothetical protein